MASRLALEDWAQEVLQTESKWEKKEFWRIRKEERTKEKKYGKYNRLSVLHKIYIWWFKQKLQHHLILKPMTLKTRDRKETQNEVRSPHSQKSGKMLIPEECCKSHL